MRNYGRITAGFVLITCLSLAGCAFQGAKSQVYAEVPSMLNILTNKAQIAVENGFYDKGGEAAVLEYVNHENPNTLIWFSNRGLSVRVGSIAETAVIMICDQGKPVYEDTYCRPGAPDKDHRSSKLDKCEITMTAAEVSEKCK